MNELPWMRFPLPISDAVLVHVGRHGMRALGIWIYATANICRHMGDYTEAELLAGLATNNDDVTLYATLVKDCVILVDKDGYVMTHTALRVIEEREEYNEAERKRKYAKRHPDKEQAKPATPSRSGNMCPLES